MQIRIFTIPIGDIGEMSQEMNVFLRSHKILTIEKQFLSVGLEGVWTFCVTYLDDNIHQETKDSDKRDYQKELEPAAAAVYSQLRDIRKNMASDAAVPPYIIFSNFELAEFAKIVVSDAELTEKTMMNVKGVGKQKVNAYGKRLIELFNQQPALQSENNNKSESEPNAQGRLFDN